MSERPKMQTNKIQQCSTKLDHRLHNIEGEVSVIIKTDGRAATLDGDLRQVSPSLFTGTLTQAQLAVLVQDDRIVRVELSRELKMN